MPALNEPSAYDRHRRIGGGGTGEAAFRPRLGATVELFGSPITLGPQHALALLCAYVMASLEGVLAIIMLYLGFLLLRAQPAVDVAAAGNGASAAATPVNRLPRQRQPGVWGTIMHFIGPAPEGQAVTLGNLLADDAVDPASSTAGQQVVGGAARSPQPSGAVAVAAAPAPYDEAKAKATRAAAARAAAARFEASARAPES